MANRSRCEICNKPSSHGLGGVLLCAPCSVDVEVEIAKLRADNRPVNIGHIARRLYRELYPDAKTYNLRDVPEQLLRRAKQLALDRGITLRQLILETLREYVDSKMGGN